MKIRSFIHQIILLIALYSQWNIAKDFIFDFGGVLILTNKMTSFKHVGMRNIIACSFQLCINPFSLQKYLQEKFFTILNHIAHTHNISPTLYQQAYDEKGNPLPTLINAWLQGSMLPAQIIALIEQTIDTN